MLRSIRSETFNRQEDSMKKIRIDIEKGLGAVTIDGEKVTDFGTSGNGQHSLEIETGVGSVNLKFQENE